MQINIRKLVKELLGNENLLVCYNELNDGGFDLSVRIDEEKPNTSEEELPHIGTAEYPNIHYVCPHCYSENIQAVYGTINTDGSNHRTHYFCEDCHKEFDILKN